MLGLAAGRALRSGAAGRQLDGGEGTTVQLNGELDQKDLKARFSPELGRRQEAKCGGAAVAAQRQRSGQGVPAQV